MLTIHGQSRAIAQLQRSLRADRLASTWIFAGPQGVGKFTLAVELAKTKLCDTPQHKKNSSLGEHKIAQLPDNFELSLPCDACESCRAINSGNHPDLHIITKELIRMHDVGGKSKGTVLSIHVIRGEITGDPNARKESKIGKRSFRGKGKFFLIDDADLMEPPAQNALLKSLEEPPPDTYLILITASPQELLSTIQSRSQLVMLNELPDAIIVPRLVAAGITDKDAALLARLARGSLGRALRWAHDIQIIERENTKAADRKAKAAERAGVSAKSVADTPDEDADAESSDKFTPGGILTWTRDLTARLDALVAGTAAASDVAAVIAQYAAEYSGLQLQRDKLTSADRARRDGIGLMMSIAAEWFTDRLRHALGTAHATPLPGKTSALDYALVPKLIAAARAAEAQIDLNANDKILLAATCTQWEQLLKHQ
jgi:DNA polymerase III subunit delta'